MGKSVLLFNLRNLENVLQRNLRTGTARECIFKAQGLKISANHGAGKGVGQLEDVTGLPEKSLDTSPVLTNLLHWHLKPLSWQAAHLHCEQFCGLKHHLCASST